MASQAFCSAQIVFYHRFVDLYLQSHSLTTDFFGPFTFAVIAFGSVIRGRVVVLLFRSMATIRSSRCVILTWI